MSNRLNRDICSVDRQVSSLFCALITSVSKWDKTFISFLILIGSLLVGGSVRAQVRASCHKVFLNIEDPVNASYLDTIAKWDDVWARNILSRMRKAKESLSDPMNFNIQNFLRSRQFRSWFEVSNRMAVENLKKHEPSVARVKLLTNPKEALATKLLAIREARYTVDFSYYIFKNDEAGLAILGELKDALRRGVSVRIVIDAFGSGALTPQTHMKSLIDFADREGGMVRDLKGQFTGTRAKVEIVAFNSPLSLPVNILRGLARDIQNLAYAAFGRPLTEALGYSINRRSHDKILLIDGAFEEKAIAFIGGRNMKKTYYDLSKVESENVVDVEVMMRGVARSDDQTSVSMGVQVQEYFDQVYFHLGNTLMTRSLLGMVMGYKRPLQQIEDVTLQTKQELGLLENEKELREILLNDGLETHQVEVVNTFHNIFKNDVMKRREVSEHKLAVQNQRSLLLALDKHLKDEKEEITIVTPYLWMSKKQIRMLKRWLLADPQRKLTLVTNSILTNNSLLSQILIDSVLGPELILDSGLVDKTGRVFRRSIADQVQIYEYGRLDSTVLGGHRSYGLLHMKGIYLRSQGMAILGTYNNDPRSMLLNSEGAAFLRGSVAGQLNDKIQEIIKDSHAYGSVEYWAIRSHEKLPKMKRFVAEKTDLLHNLMIKLHLWWLI